MAIKKPVPLAPALLSHKDHIYQVVLYVLNTRFNQWLES